MPIHDQSYRRYAGAREQLGNAWLVIAGSGIRGIIRKRRFLGLLLFAWMPFFVRAIQIYLAANFPTMSMLAATAETFREFLEQQGLFVFLITVWVGAGLIANDKRVNALQIYLSKPLTRIEYVAGKLAILAVFLLLVTWVPAMLLLLLQMLFAGSFAFVRANLFLFPAITVFSLLQVLLASFTMLALSSLTKSSRYVGILYAGAVFFTDAVYGVVYSVTDNSSLSWMSFPANLRQLGDVVFRLRPRYETPWIVSLMVVAALIGVSMLVLERRVRGVEVVA
jgi:ABC-2 type transport system permease protein